MIACDIKTIPHEFQRYPTVGDYITDDMGVVHYRISDFHNWRYELCIAVHEMVERMLTVEAGISEEDIDAFDIDYEINRPKGDTSEPGDSPNAPYKDQHALATRIEKFIAAELGVNWDVYEKVIADM